MVLNLRGTIVSVVIMVAGHDVLPADAKPDAWRFSARYGLGPMAAALQFDYPLAFQPSSPSFPLP